MSQLTDVGHKGKFRSGFAALVGRPNVGKSTLLNAMVGQKVAIMSPKPQTTRHRIRGVLTDKHSQIIFMDTPGIHKAEHRLGEYMVEAAEAAFKEVDLILFVVDATEPEHHNDQFVIEKLKKIRTPMILVINKVDAVPKPEILKMIASYSEKLPFKEIIPVSAKSGTQLEKLKEIILKYLPEGPQFYPSDVVTDHPEQFIIAEYIREKVLRLTREEVPHSVMVDIEQMEYRANNVLYVSAVIYTERQSQKGILIGKGGSMLKQVGEMARTELESLFGTKIFVELWVKVKKDWRNEPGLLRQFGFNQE